MEIETYSSKYPPIHESALVWAREHRSAVSSLLPQTLAAVLDEQTQEMFGHAAASFIPMDWSGSRFVLVVIRFLGIVDQRDTAILSLHRMHGI